MSSQPAPRSRTALDEVADDYVDLVARLDPFLATALGVTGHDHEATDYTAAGFAARTDAARAVLRAVDAVPDADAVDTVTRAAMQERLGLEIDLDDALVTPSQVNNIDSPLQSRDVLDQMPTDTAEDWEVIAERLRAMPDSLAGWGRSLRECADQGAISSRRQLELGAQEARGYAAADTGFFARFARDAVGGDALREEVSRQAAATARAYEELADVLEELIPRAPESDAVGRDAYALRSRVFVGDTIDLEETYAWGIQELQSIIAEQEQIAQRINDRAGNGGGRSVEAARAALDQDPERTLHGTDALQAWMQELADTAVADLAGSHFDIPEPLHRLECRIARTGSGGIYYTGPSEDLSRPGRMWWDVPEGVTEFHTWAETTTVYHEGVPGHHLQVGTQTLQTQQLNRWRALLCWVSGHGEGWALYAERLMEQLGYLEDDGDRLGMLDAQRLRAGRVVLDIGFHCGFAMPEGLAASPGGPWTYEKAWDFMSAHWGMREAEQRFELHRYLGWPGQAPSYKLGQRAWERLRDEHAGDDLRGFHRRALELGSLPLSVLGDALA